MVNKIKKKFSNYLTKLKKKAIKKVIKTSFIKKKVNEQLIQVVSFILRYLINIFLCYFFIFDNVFMNFILEIIFSILTTSCNEICFDILYIYNDNFYSITRYFLNNYNEDNLNKWRITTVLSLSMVLLISLFFITINNYKLIIITIEYIICFLIIEMMKERRILQSIMFLRYFYEKYIYKPKVLLDSKFEIIENHTIRSENKISDDYEIIN